MRKFAENLDKNRRKPAVLYFPQLLLARPGRRPAEARLRAVSPARREPGARAAGSPVGRRERRRRRRRRRDESRRDLHVTPFSSPRQLHSLFLSGNAFFIHETAFQRNFEFSKERDAPLSAVSIAAIKYSLESP